MAVTTYRIVIINGFNGAVNYYAEGGNQNAVKLLMKRLADGSKEFIDFEDNESGIYTTLPSGWLNQCKFELETVTTP